MRTNQKYTVWHDYTQIKKCKNNKNKKKDKINTKRNKGPSVWEQIQPNSKATVSRSAKSDNKWQSKLI